MANPFDQEGDSGWLLTVIDGNDRRYEQRFRSIERAVEIAHETVRENRSDWMSILALIVSIGTAIIVFVIRK